MSRCTDKKYEAMIYAYELGLLTDQERSDFELHLYECEHCFQSVQEFMPAVREIRENKDLKKLVSELAEQNPARPAGHITPHARRSRRRYFWPTLVPASLATAIILLFLIFKPFRVEIKPTLEAVAAENSLVVLTFENLNDPQDTEKYGSIVSNLLITDLAESQYLQVVSNQRLTDMISYINHQDSTLSRAELALQVARKTNSIWILSGTIMQIDPEIIITSEIIDALSGQVLASQKIIGSETDNIFSLVDKLTVAVKSDLSIPEQALQEDDLHIGEATTNSQDAYRHYIEGVDYYSKFYNSEARNSFHKALEYDSSFAMAYLFLAMLENRSYIDQALQYSEHNPWKEKRYIIALKYRLDEDTAQSRQTYNEILKRYPFEKDAYYSLGLLSYRNHDYESAIEFMRKAVEIDPFFKSALNILAYAYNQQGDLDSALATIDDYVLAAPNEPNPYDTKADILSENGRIKEAITAYRMALQINPDFTHSIFNLGILYIINGNYDEARQCFIDLASGINSNNRSSGRLYHASVPLYQGKFREALQILDDAIAANNLERETIRHASYNHVKAMIYTELENWDKALLEIRRSMQLYQEQYPQNVVFNHSIYIYILAASGNIAEAELEAGKLREDLDSKAGDESDYWFALGSIEFFKGNYDQAGKYLETASQGRSNPDYPDNMLLSRIYIESGRYSEALELLANMVDNNSSWRLYWGPWAVTPYYYLGLVNENLGDMPSAISNYEKFIALWKNADADMVKIQDAEQRLRNLRDQS